MSCFSSGGLILVEFIELWKSLGLHGRTWGVGTATLWAIAQRSFARWGSECHASARFPAMVEGGGANRRAYRLHSAQSTLWRTAKCCCRLCAAADQEMLSLPGAMAFKHPTLLFAIGTCVYISLMAKKHCSSSQHSFERVLLSDK